MKKKSEYVPLRLFNDNLLSKCQEFKDFDETKFIDDINRALRTKYLNQAKLYQPFDDIELLDKTFVTETFEEIILYANLTPENFLINNEYFLKDINKAFERYIKTSEYGIDHGYFIGDLTPSNINFSKNEVIQVKLIIPKGTEITRIGSITENTFILPRNQVFKYLEKTIKEDNNNSYIEISASIVSQEELSGACEFVEDDINELLENEFDITAGAMGVGFCALEPLGLNAGAILDVARDAIELSFSILKNSGILSIEKFDKNDLVLTNGKVVHTQKFIKDMINLPIDEQIKLFDINYDESTLGVTFLLANNTAYTTVSADHFMIIDALPQINQVEDIASTILHEFFHYFIFINDNFKNRPVYQDGDDLAVGIESSPDTQQNSLIRDRVYRKLEDNPTPFQNTFEMLLTLEGDTLCDLLNSTYPKQDWEEFACEAFSAMLHPNSDIKAAFSERLPLTNRILTSLYDFESPETPESLELVKKTALNATITFHHSKDNVGVSNYNIYLNGEFNKSIVIDKDENGLAYPNPGDVQNAPEVLIVDLKPLTDYVISVSAVDEALNESYSVELEFRTSNEIEDLTTLELQDIKISKGQEFDPNSPLQNVTDKDGVRLTADDIEAYFIDRVNTKNLDTSNTGKHLIYIGYPNASGELQYSADATITVED